MKLFEVHLLTQKEQNAFLKGNKVFINDTRNRKYLFKLFSTGEFFVEETWLRPVNVLLNVSCFTSVNRLQRYLEVIDVSALLMLYSPFS